MERAIPSPAPLREKFEIVEPIGLSIAQVCALSGIGRTRIFAAIGTKALVARKCGRRTVVLREDLIAFLRGLPLR